MNAEDNGLRGKKNEATHGGIHQGVSSQEVQTTESGRNAAGNNQGTRSGNARPIHGNQVGDVSHVAGPTTMEGEKPAGTGDSIRPTGPADRGDSERPTSRQDTRYGIKTR